MSNLNNVHKHHEHTLLGPFAALFYHFSSLVYHSSLTHTHSGVSAVGHVFCKWSVSSRKYTLEVECQQYIEMCFASGVSAVVNAYCIWIFTSRKCMAHLKFLLEEMWTFRVSWNAVVYIPDSIKCSGNEVDFSLFWVRKCCPVLYLTVAHEIWEFQEEYTNIQGDFIHFRYQSSCRKLDFFLQWRRQFRVSNQCTNTMNIHYLGRLQLYSTTFLVSPTLYGSCLYTHPHTHVSRYNINVCLHDGSRAIDNTSNFTQHVAWTLHRS